MGNFKFLQNVQKSNKTVVISYISEAPWGDVAMGLSWNAEVDSCIRGSNQKH